MPLDKPLEKLTEGDLLGLKDTAEAESRTLDYKLSVHTDPWDCRADISALANTAGGHLIFGVQEQAGVPVDLPGLTDPNPDAVKLRLEQILGSNVEPRLPHVGMKHVPLANGNWCLVVRVPHSWAQPHAVVRDQSRKFWARHSSGNFVMDVGQLRTAFTLSANVEERIRDFRIQRLNLLQAAEERTARVVFHLIPLTAFTSEVRFDLAPLQNSGGHYDQLIRWGHTSRYTLDGLLYRHSPGADQVPQGNYALFFRNGSVEAVETEYVRQGAEKPERFAGFNHDRRLVDHLGRLLAAQKTLGVEPPIFVLLTLVGVKGWKVWVDTFWNEVRDPHPIDRDILPLSAAILESFSTPPELVLRDILHEFWQASGWPQCFSYDPDGNWKPREK